MNKFEVTLNWLQTHIKPQPEWTLADVQCYETIIEALKLQISMPPQLNEQGIRSCPCCNKIVFRLNRHHKLTDHCSCGQRLFVE